MATTYNALNYDDVLNKINQASTLYNTPKYQDANYLNQATNSIMEASKPQLNQQNALTNQQYNNSARALAENLAQSGANRGGSANRSMMGLEQGRNTQLGQNYNNMYSQAQSQAQNQAQLGLQESNMLQNQAQTAAAQLSNLLSQYQNNAYNEANLTGTYNGQQTLAAQQLANQIAQQALANRYTEAGLTGLYNGQNTLARQQLDAEKQNALNTLAAGIMASYAQGTDQFTLPSSVTSLLDRIFTNANY